MTDTSTVAPPPPVEAMGSGPISQRIGQTRPEQLNKSQLPSEQGNTAGNAMSTVQGVNPALATNIAKAIALGLLRAPTTAAEWAKAVDQFSTLAGADQIKLAVQRETQNQEKQPQQGQTPAQQGTSSGGTGINAFLAAIRSHESGGDYRANSGDGAYGAYQFIPSTWNSEATAAGFGKYANGRADQAPPSVQDAVAAHMAQGYYNQFNGNFNMMARAWFDPAYVNDPNYAPPGNNGLTIGAYGQDIVNLMGQHSAYTDAGSPTAGASGNVVKIVQSQLGTPYVWGGEDPMSPGHRGSFDCSGLVQWVYGQAGTKLPRVAQAQYDATPKVAGPLQPGDLVFFGSGPHGIEHVGIYIGNGEMIDAPHTGADVRVDRIFDAQGRPTWAGYVGATRPADPTGATTAAPGTQIAQHLQQSNGNFGAILQTVIANLSKMSEAQRERVAVTLQPLLQATGQQGQAQNG